MKGKLDEVTNKYFQNVIKNSWTWQRLTEEEKQRFVNIDIFNKIKGNKHTREQRLFTIYVGFLSGLGFDGSFRWRATEKKKEEAFFLKQRNSNFKGGKIMTKVEYARCEKLMEEAIQKAKDAQEDFIDAQKEDDQTQQKILCERGQNRLGYAEGINQTLVCIGFKHERMKELGDLL